MVNHCSLNDWGTNSQCTHAVSSTPEGPYVFNNTVRRVVLPIRVFGDVSVYYLQV